MSNRAPDTPRPACCILSGPTPQGQSRSGQGRGIREKDRGSGGSRARPGLPQPLTSFFISEEQLGVTLDRKEGK